jgi:hypothetical protein
MTDQEHADQVTKAVKSLNDPHDDVSHWFNRIPS